EFRTLGSDPKHPDPKSVPDRATAQKLISAPATTPLPALFSARRSLSLWDLADKLKVMTERSGVRSEALARLANTYLRLARPDLALQVLEGAPDTGDRSVAYLIHYFKATAYRTMGDMQTAQV